MNDKYDCLFEWAVWASLDSKTDLELILLKGHLLIEQILEIKLNSSGIQNGNMLSFYSKVLAFKKINFQESQKKKIIHTKLEKVNKLRNNLAHDYYFDLNNGEFELWAKGVLNELNGKKYTRFTFRTKIVHAFSTLAINILELTDNKGIEKRLEPN